MTSGRVSSSTDMVHVIKVCANSRIGALWWAAGPWWGTYMFSLEPSTGPAYSTYVPLITAYE